MVFFLTPLRVNIFPDNMFEMKQALERERVTLQNSDEVWTKKLLVKEQGYDVLLGEQENLKHEGRKMTTYFEKMLMREFLRGFYADERIFTRFLC
jgi:hypothetical protein